MLTGLNGFQGRSRVPKGPMVNPTTQASLHSTDEGQAGQVGQGRQGSGRMDSTQGH